VAQPVIAEQAPSSATAESCFNMTLHSKVDVMVTRRARESPPRATYWPIEGQRAGLLGFGYLDLKGSEGGFGLRLVFDRMMLSDAARGLSCPGANPLASSGSVLRITGDVSSGGASRMPADP
jgi:hypothetical protein